MFAYHSVPVGAAAVAGVTVGATGVVSVFVGPAPSISIPSPLTKVNPPFKVVKVTVVVPFVPAQLPAGAFPAAKVLAPKAVTSLYGFCPLILRLLPSGVFIPGAPQNPPVQLNCIDCNGLPGADATGGKIGAIGVNIDEIFWLPPVIVILVDGMQ